MMVAVAASANLHQLAGQPSPTNYEVLDGVPRVHSKRQAPAFTVAEEARQSNNACGFEKTATHVAYHY